MGGWQNYGPFLGTLNTRYRMIIMIQKGTIILTTTICTLHPRSFGFVHNMSCLLLCWRHEELNVNQ